MWNLLWETSSPRFPLKSLNLASANLTRNVLEHGCLTTAFVNCIKRAYCYATFECFGLCLKWDDSVSVFRLWSRDKICFFVLIWGQKFLNWPRWNFAFRVVSMTYNHACQIWWRSVKGFGVARGRILGVSTDLRRRHCNTVCCADDVYTCNLHIEYS